MIIIENVSCVFGNLVVLDQINLQLAEQKIGIIGANGGGKSTFVRLLNGLQLPSSGRVLIDGLDTKDQGKEVRKKVGFVFQNPDNQIVFPIVEEDIAFGLKNLGFKKDEITSKVNDILSYFKLSHLSQHQSHLLSGGQKQLLAIAGILVMQPDYIIFDEPTTLLDLRNKGKIFDVINHLKQNTIVVTHDLKLLENFDRVIVFDLGKIVADTTPLEAINCYTQLMQYR